MGDTLARLFNNVKGWLTWWVIVAPWERALRVRLGKRVVVLDAGIHFRIPGVDRIHIQGIRMRAADLPLQTVTTKDGKAITMAGVLQYAIYDLLKLYNTLQHAEDTIVNLATAIIAQYVATHGLDDCTPAAIQQYVDENIDLSQYGIDQVKCSVVDYAVVKTYRIIKDERRMSYGDSLSTGGEVQFGTPAANY